MVGLVGLMAMITSRIRLRVSGEREFPVAPLLLDEPKIPKRPAQSVSSSSALFAFARPVPADPVWD
jgi:hypothetical protein